MKKINAEKASKGFGKLMDDAQLEPVTVEKNGKPKVVIYSFEEAQYMESLKEAQFEAFIQAGIKDAEEGRIRPLTEDVKSEILAKARGRFEKRQS